MTCHIKRKCLPCLPGAGQSPALETNMPCSIGGEVLRQSEGICNLCSGLDPARPAAVMSGGSLSSTMDHRLKIRAHLEAYCTGSPKQPASARHSWKTKPQQLPEAYTCTGMPRPEGRPRDCSYEKKGRKQVTRRRGEHHGPCHLL